MKFNWKSSISSANKVELVELERKMADYYSNSNSYYSDIDYNWDAWLKSDEICEQDIISLIRKSDSVLEIGCGRANILRCYPEFERKYYGIEFSEELIEVNKLKYPEAHFYSVKDMPQLSEIKKFDLVFSHFVLEHVVFPKSFIELSIECLNPYGKLVILCPDFIGRGCMTSQQVGLSQGTGREKLADKRFLDAVITFLDSRIVMKLYCLFWKYLSRISPQFVINMQPTCFTYKFIPDVDAVYVTNKEEIIRCFSPKIKWDHESGNMADYCNTKKLIYLKGSLK